MAIVTPSTTQRIVRGGQTGSSIAGGFLSFSVDGLEDLVANLLRAAVTVGADANKPLNAACREALKPVMKTYAESINEVTGNLKRSVTVRNFKKKTLPGVGGAIGGPRHFKEGDKWDVEKRGAGNHAWLHEFGTGPRRPGTQGRRTLVNVHQRINGRFRRVGDGNQWLRNDEFDRLGGGNFFIMSSYEKRKNFRGRGYPGEFLMALESGDTYGAMPAAGKMEAAIRSSGSAVMSTLMQALADQVDKVSRAA
jgi:hypothetical protein